MLALKYKKVRSILSLKLPYEILIETLMSKIAILSLSSTFAVQTACGNTDTEDVESVLQILRRNPTFEATDEASCRKTLEACCRELNYASW